MSNNILDSGNRTEFDSGAVRDVQDDKGRCDLMPLHVAEEFLGFMAADEKILSFLEDYKKDGKTEHLYAAIRAFSKVAYNDRYEALFEVSIHFRDGAEKYGENNWQKGLPEWSYLSSAVRHYLKWLRGDKDERHDRAFVWNILCLIWTVENKRKPVLPEKPAGGIKHQPDRVDEDWNGSGN